MELPDGDNDARDSGLLNHRNWLIVLLIREQSAASCNEVVARSVLMLLRLRKIFTIIMQTKYLLIFVLLVVDGIKIDRGFSGGNVVVNFVSILLSVFVKKLDSSW